MEKLGKRHEEIDIIQPARRCIEEHFDFARKIPASKRIRIESKITHFSFNGLYISVEGYYMLHDIPKLEYSPIKLERINRDIHWALRRPLDAYFWCSVNLLNIIDEDYVLGDKYRFYCSTGIDERRNIGTLYYPVYLPNKGTNHRIINTYYHYAKPR